MKKTQEKPGKIIENTAEQLAGLKELTPPTWAPFVKTGAHKQRVPERKDWWYVRAASILRTVNKKGPVGTEKLRTHYGGKRNRGHKTERQVRGSGSILRKILQQLEKAGLVEQKEKGVHKGRVVTGKGAKVLNSATRTDKKQENGKIQTSKQEKTTK